MLFDQTCRAGVSIQLSTEIISPSLVDQEVVLLIKVDKVGKYIGNCSMAMHDTSGNLVARGKHIKFMYTGAVWDFFFCRWVLPFTLSLIAFFTSNPLGVLLTSLFAGKRNKGESDFRNHFASRPDLFDAFNIRPVSDSYPSAEGSIFEWETRTDFTNPLGIFIALVQFLLTACFFLDGVGYVHGGAIALAIEKACLLATAGELGKEPDRLFSGLEVNYFSPAKASLLCSLVAPILILHLSLFHLRSKF